MPAILRKPSLIFVSVFFLASSMWIFGHRQLGGFDMSALIDTGWRMSNGQIPYKDFPLTTPVAFYLGAGWAVQLFGATWSSFVIAAILFTVLSFLFQVYLLNLILPWKPALAISFISQVLCSVVISYWWYNSITMNSSCLFISAAFVFANKPDKRSSAISLWATLTLLSFMKPNMAGGLAIFVFIALFIFSPRRGKLVLIGFVAIASFFIGLLLIKISPLDVIQSYLAIGKGRAIPSLKWFYNDKPYEHLVTIPIMIFSLLPMLELISRFNFQKNISFVKTNLAIAIASYMMGVLSLLTNSDSSLIVGVPFFLLGTTVFYFSTEARAALTAPRKVWQLIAILCIIFILIGSATIQAHTPKMWNFWFIEAVLCGIATIGILISKSPQSTISLFHDWQRERIVWAMLLICGAIAIFAGGMRWRVSYIGHEMFYTYSSLTEVDNIPFFKNFQLSPNAKITLQEIQQVLQENYGHLESWKEIPVYFGARIEFGYAAFGIISPKNLPIWWHPNNSYPSEFEAVYLQSFLDHQFQTSIFMKIPGTNKPDFGFLPRKAITVLTTHYNRVDYASIVIFNKK